jgi:hypothetical protein
MKIERVKINEIEKELGFDKIESIVLTNSDSKTKNEEGDYFKDWYEEEIRKLYENIEESEVL